MFHVQLKQTEVKSRPQHDLTALEKLNEISFFMLYCANSLRNRQTRVSGPQQNHHESAGLCYQMRGTRIADPSIIEPLSKIYSDYIK